MAKSTTDKAAAPATPAANAATDTARVAEPSVVSTTELPVPAVQAPVESTLEKSLAAIGIKLGAQAQDVTEPPEETAQAEPGQEPSPGEGAAKEQVDEDGQAVAQPETDVADDQAEPTLDESSSQWPESAVHEVSKLRQQKRELKSKAADAVTRLTELETRLTEAEGKLAQESVGASERRSVGASSAELADVTTMPQLERRTAEAESLLEWCDDQLIALRSDPSGVEHTLKANKIALSDRDGQEDFSRDRMEGFLLATRKKVDATLRKHVPNRQRFLEVNAQSEVKAKELFPWYADKASPEYQLSQQIIRARPDIQQWPDWKVIVGIHVLGLQQLYKAQANGSKLQAPKAAAVIAPRLPGIPGKAPVRVDPRVATLNGASEKIRKPGNGSEVVSAISALLSQTKS